MRKLIFEIRSKVLFYRLFFIMIFLMIISKEKSVVIFLLLLSYCILFLIRIYARREKLKNLYYFNIQKEGYKNDAERRADQLGDIVAIIIYLFLAIMKIASDNNMGKEFGNNLFVIILLGAIFYFMTVSVSISKNSTVLKMIAILLVTIQGLLFVLIIVSIVLVGLKSIFEGEVNSVVQLVNSVFNTEVVVTLCYFAENFLRETVVIMIASIVLLIIFISSTPPYQIEQLSTAFKIVNLLILLLGIIIYFYANISWTSIQKFLIEIKSKGDLAQFNYKMSADEIEYIKHSFSKSSITNMGYILFLPYTLGAVISNLYIEFLKKIYKRKALNYFNYILDNRERRATDDENIEFYEKKYIYYGGDKYLLKVFNITFENIYDLRQAIIDKEDSN